MAGRVNTKFVFIVSAVVIVLVGGLALVAQLAKKDSQDLAAEADRFIAEGDYKLAAESMRRAANRSKSDPVMFMRYIETAQMVPAADKVEARNTMKTVLQYSRNLVQIDPTSEEHLRNFCDRLEGYIEHSIPGEYPHNRLIYDVANERLDASPDDKLARRYRGIYGLPTLNIELSDEDINLIRDDLLVSQTNYPDDPEVAISVARWKLFDALRQDRPGGDADLAKSLREEALAISQGLIDADPDNVMHKVDHLQVLLQAKRSEMDPEDPYAVIKPLLNEVEQDLLADPQPFRAVNTAIQYFKTVYNTPLEVDDQGDDASPMLSDGVNRSIGLLREASEKFPDDLRFDHKLGTELKLISKYDECRPYIERLKKLSTEGDYRDVLLNDTLRSSAEVEYADLLISLAEKVEDDTQREAMHAESEKILEQVTAAGHGEKARILLIKGRLKLAQKKIREGLILLDKAAEKQDTFSREKAETLLLSARAREQQGDWGAAAERYEQILEANPSIPSIRLALASIYLRQRDLDAAQDHLDAVLIKDPTNERASIIQASIQAVNGDLDGAIQTYRQLDLPNRPDLAVSLAQLMIQGERQDQARAMLQHYFDADPSNLAVLAVLASTIDDIEMKTEMIARSRQAGGDPKLLDILEEQLDPELAGDIERRVKIRTEKVDDPVLREITAARLYERAGEGVKAREAIARAAAIDPDHKSVIDVQFAYALRDSDLDLAQQLSDKATQGNLDEAGGRFYQAQLFQARGDSAGAITTLRAGLEIVPINSEGWRLLGDAYVAQSNDREAVPAYERALEQKPDNLGAIRGLAAIRDRQGRHDEALEMLRLALSQNPGHGQLLELYLFYEGRYGNKQTALQGRREIQKQQPDDVKNLRAMAMLLAETGATDEAEQLMRDLIAKHGQDQPNVMTLASVFQASGQPERGAQTLGRYIESLGANVSSADYIILARYLMQTKDGQGALQAYQQAISIESDKREASRELAGTFFSRSSYDRAVPLYRDLFQQFPEEQALGLRLADALIRTKAFDEAVQVLEQFEGGATEDALAALIAEHNGNHDEAIRLINQAIDADPSKNIFYYERAALNANDPDRIDQAIQDLNTSLSLDPGHLLSRRLLVSMYHRRGDRNEAIRELTNMVSRHPDDRDGRLMLVRVYLQEGSTTRAKNLIRQALERSPDDPFWLTALGDLAVSEDDTAGAIQAYKRVFDVAPSPAQLLKVITIQVENGRANDAQTLLRDNAGMVNSQPILQAMMGRALYATGKADQARQVFSRAAERCGLMDQLMGVAIQIRKDYTLEETASLLKGLTGGPSTYWVELSLANLELSDGQAQQAAERLAALEASLPAEASTERQRLHMLIAPALHQSGQVEQALTYYQQVVQSTPDNPHVLNNMAYLLADELNRPDEALPHAERAAELQPQSAQILDTLGWIQFKLGMIDQARLTLEKSIAAESVTANHLHLAELLIEQGSRTEASRHLQTAVDLAEQGNEAQMLERAQELLKQIEDLTEAS